MIFESGAWASALGFGSGAIGYRSPENSAIYPIELGTYLNSSFLLHFDLTAVPTYLYSISHFSKYRNISRLSTFRRLIRITIIIIKMASNLQTQPPSSSSFILTYPKPNILLVTINRENAMNSIPSFAHWDAEAIFAWFDKEPSLRVAIITGAGKKAFCAGQDLIEQAKFKTSPPPASARKHPPSGFCGISRRTGKKPIIAAVNGFALGGGFEICLNW